MLRHGVDGRLVAFPRCCAVTPQPPPHHHPTSDLECSTCPLFRPETSRTWWSTANLAFCLRARTQRPPLLHVLRNDLCLNGPKFGCGLGQCGACTVLVDGVAARACVIAATGVAEPGTSPRSKACQTGLADQSTTWTGRRGPCRRCAAPGATGVCRRPGRAMRLLPQRHGDDGRGLAGAKPPTPTMPPFAPSSRAICARCGTHVEIMRAVQRAAVLLQEAKA